MAKWFVLFVMAAVGAILTLNGCGKSEDAAAPTVAVQVKASKF